MSESSSVTIRLVESSTAFWRVREFESTRTSGGIARVSLICESPSTVRRLWVFPENWHSFSDPELLTLFGLR